MKRHAKTRRDSIPPVVVGPSIDEATLTFVRTIMESTTQPHPSQALALNAFTTAFQQWNPQTMSDVKVTDKATLDIVFAPAPVPPHYDQVFMAVLQKHRNRIGVLVQSFNVSLSSGQLTLVQLRDACAMIDSQVWDSYKLFRGTVNLQPIHMQRYRGQSPQLVRVPVLPSIQTIIQELNKLEELKQPIENYTHVRIQGKSYLLADYVNDIHDLRTDIEKCSTSTLNSLLQNIQRRIGNNPDSLYWYIYFRLHPSILLEHNLAANPNFPSGRDIDIHAKCKRIRDAFGADMSYEGVGTALKLLSNRNAYKAEIKVLLNCEILKISARDVTNFRAVRLLHEISQPLQDALQCCDEHQFMLVTSDPSFSALRSMVKDFYSTASHGRESCLDFMNQLHCKLCGTADTNDSKYAIATSLRKINQLKLSIDALLSLQYALHGLKLRNYFRTMQWLTVDEDIGSNEGIQKFDSDYQTLRLLLHSNDATEELMIVDSLKPVVQMFSYLEQHCQNCPRIYELVSRMKNDGAMQTLLRTTVTLPADVHDVNSRIYALQDVFQEIAPPVTTPTPPTVTSNPEAVLSA